MSSGHGPGIAGSSPSYDAGLAPPGDGHPAGIGWTQEELRQSTSVLDTLPDGVVLVGPAGRIVHVNAELERLSGFAAADLVGRPVEVLVPEADREGHAAWHRDFAAAPTTRLMGHGGPLRLRRSDATVLPVEISLGPADVGDQRLTVAVIRDLRSRQQLEQRLALVADLLDTITDSVVVVDVATGTRTYANRVVLERAATSRSEFETGPIGSQLVPEDREKLREALASVTSGRLGETSVQVRVQDRDGRIFPADMRLCFQPPAATDPDSEPGQGHVVVVSRDISALTAVETRLRAREQLFRSVFEQSPVGICLIRVDASGHRRIVQANQALADIFGRSVDDLAGIDTDQLIMAEDHEFARRTATRFLAGEEELAQPRLRRYLRPDGRLVWAEVRATVLSETDRHDPDRRSVEMLMHMVDVTARVREEMHRTRRAGLADLVAQISTRVLAGQPSSETYQQVVEGAAGLLEARHTALGLPDPVTGRFRVVAMAGPLAALRDEAPVDQEFVGELASRPKASRFRPPAEAAARMPGGVGPCAAMPFRVSATRSGAMTLMRPPGEPEFDDEDLELLDHVGHQLSLVVELGAAQADRERLALLEQRHQLARDLHDTVIQDLFAIGMQLDAQERRAGRAGTSSHEGESAPIDQASILDQLDQAVRRLRGLVFDLGPSPDRQRLSEQVRALRHEVGRVLGFEPALALSGPIDTLAAPVGAELLAVLREALSNVAQHASAGTASVELEVRIDPAVGGEVRLIVEDDGVGIAPTMARGNGLDNIVHRARSRGGHAEISPRRPTGTRLTWAIPLPTGQVTLTSDPRPPESP